jgi:hypothetical protein
LGLLWTSPHPVILTTPSAVKLNRIPQWQHFSRIKHLRLFHYSKGWILLHTAGSHAVIPLP